jgi:hypothetical protein
MKRFGGGSNGSQFVVVTEVQLTMGRVQQQEACPEGQRESQHMVGSFRHLAIR